MTAAGPAGASGTVVGLFRKPETPGERGLPKAAASSVRVVRAGVELDYNRFRQEERHGDPAMALLILTEETLEALRRDGWPVRPGDLGENVLTRGISYDKLAPPGRVRLGEVVVELSKACTPCTFLYGLPYVGKERGPAFLRATLDRRGWYASIVDEGTIRVGDPVERLA